MEPMAARDYMVTERRKPSKAEAKRRPSRKERQDSADSWGKFMKAMVKNQNR